MSDRDIRITAEELKRRMAAGEDFIVLDTRNPQAWGQAADQAHGAIRVDLHAGDVALPKVSRDKPAVAYCT